MKVSDVTEGAPLRVGDVLDGGEDAHEYPNGFCGGMFGRDSYDVKRVEAIGADWVVARGESWGPEFAACDPENLVRYRRDR